MTGTDASFVLTTADTQEDQLVSGHSPALLGEQWGTEPPPSYGTLYAEAGPRIVRTERGRWDLFYPAFAAAVLRTGDVPVPARDAIATAVVLDAARTSATTHPVVPIEPL